MDHTSNRPPLDDPMTERANDLDLPASLQDTFEIAVYQKHKISERLRVEKELFPECIQAPATYYNKRKSLNASKRGKENRHTSVFPGEETSSSHDLTMNKSRNYVQEWLNKQPNVSLGMQPRSPFTDLKVNTHHTPPAHSTPIKGKQKENAPKLPTRVSNRKRSRLKQTPSSSLTSLENYLKPPEKGKDKKPWTAKRMKQEFDDASKQLGNKQRCDESGIVIDDDCYTIEDTQDQTLDKDRLALLEVEKANRRELSESVIVIGDTDENHSNHSIEASTSIKHDEGKIHVPFYKKSLLFENCQHCITAAQTLIDKSKVEMPDRNQKPSDVSITVENNSFITMITVVDCNPINSKKQSTEVQTDVTEPFLGFEQPTQRESTDMIAKIREYIETEVNSLSGEEIVPGTDSQKTAYTDVVLEKQDEDIKADENNLEDKAFGHSSEHDFGVLTALHGAGFQNRRKRGPRGATPDSNNSSDKENRDPNRKKKGDGKKKKKNK